MIHRLAHWLGWNLGRVETWTENHRTFVAFRCSRCGRLSGAEDITAEIDRMTAAPAPETEREG